MEYKQIVFFSLERIIDPFKFESLLKSMKLR